MVNLAVMLLIIAALILGIASVIPVKSPTSGLFTEITSQNGFPSGVFKTLKPKVVAEAINSNPGQLSDMMKELDPKMVGRAINKNGKWVAQFVSYLDPKAAGSSVSENIKFVADLLDYVDLDVIAGVVDGSGEFAKELLYGLDPKIIASNAGGNTRLADKLISLIDPRVLASALSSKEGFLVDSVSSLSPDAVANTMNANPEASSRILGYLNVDVLADFINANESFAAELLGELNPDLMAGAAKQNPQMTNYLMNRLDPVVVADILNDSAGIVTGVLDRPSPELIDAVSDAQAFSAKLVAKLSPSAIGGFANQLGGSAFSFINALDPAVIAGVLNKNVNLVVAAGNASDPGIMATIVENEQSLNSVISRINPAMIATAMNANSTMTIGILAHLKPQVVAGIADTNADWLAALEGAMPPGKTAAGINASGGFLSVLVSRLDPAVVAAAMNANPDSTSRIMELLNPSLIAGVVNNNGEFVKNLLKNLNTSELADAINADPLGTSALVGELHRLNAEKVIADILSANGTVVSELMNRMDPRGTALIVNTPAGESFFTALLGQINAPVLADAINNNANFVKGMITNMATPGYARWSSLASKGNDFTARLAGSLRPELLASIINSCPDKISELIGKFAGSDDRLKAIASAINQNPSFLSNAVKYLNTADIIELINTNPDMQRVVLQLVGKIDPGVLASAISGSNTLSAMLETYNARGKGGVNPDLVRQLLENDGVVAFLESLINKVGGQGIVKMLTQSGNFIGDLLDVTKSGLKPELLVKLVKAMQGTPTYGFGAMQLDANVVFRGDPVGNVTITSEGWSQFLDARVSDKPATPRGWDSANQSFAPW